MKRLFTILLLAFMVLSSFAQEPLAGRVYHNGNLIARELKEVKKDVDELGKEAENEEEKSEVKGLSAIMDAIVSKMTVTFIDDQSLELSFEMRFDEQKAKDGGASWAIRKLIRSRIGKDRFNKGQVPYTVDGRIITAGNPNKKDTSIVLELSEDGQSLTCRQKQKVYILRRTK